MDLTKIDQNYYSEIFQWRNDPYAREYPLTPEPYCQFFLSTNFRPEVKITEDTFKQQCSLYNFKI